MSLLRVVDLAKKFNKSGDRGSANVIEKITFDVEEGEFLTIIGPSGSGKSTLLNLIAQTDNLTGGEIWIGGRKVLGNGATALDPGLNRQVGYITQDDTLLPWRTTLQNVLYSLSLKEPISAESRGRASELIRAVGLSGYENHYPHELSGGMRKRASIIRTLVYDPPIILMDEPFGALDAQTRLQLQSDLLKLWDREKKTILFVTHDIGEAIALGDRVLVLSRQPTIVAACYDIPYERPRDIEGAMAWPGFPDLYNQIRSQVH